jgi:ATP diphosphatase
MNSIARLKEIMALLRDPEKGCPWDVEQTFKSISPNTIEEAYEVVDAIEKGDMHALKEELGDLLLQVIFHSQMADEQGHFKFDDVVEVLNQKLIDRHPHIFGDEIITTAKEQEESWEKIKKQERDKKADGGHASILGGVAITLPALTRAVKIQKRAAKVGFDWPNLTYVFDKIDEELVELKEAINDNSNIAEEYGDLLFILSNLGRKLNLDPEVCLRGCSGKFERRFHHIEKSLIEQGMDIEKATLEQMDKLWDEAKGMEKKN